MSRSRWGPPSPARRAFRREDDPCPPGGLCESVYAGLHARTGEWPADFLEIVRRAYNGQIPRRFHARSAAIRAELERANALELEELERPRAPRVVNVWIGEELVGTYDPSEPLDQSPAVSGPDGGGGGGGSLEG